MNKTDSKKIRLLKVTRKRLRYIVSCILQTSPKVTEDYLGKAAIAVTAKVAATGTSVGLLSFVSTIGTAGTGTSIAGLSGAAATSAKLAWVGNIVGGGVTAGTAITAGIVLIVTVATIKCLASAPRPEESLDEIDRLVINTCAILVTQIDAELETGNVPTDNELALTCAYAIQPLCDLLLNNEITIAARLDKKNKAAFLARAVPNFVDDVLEEFEQYC